MWLHENLTQIQDLIRDPTRVKRVARIGGLPRRCRRPTQPPTEATLIVYAHFLVLVPFQNSAKNVFVAYSAPPEHLRGDPRLLLTPSLIVYAHLHVLVPFQISAKNAFVAYSAPPGRHRGDPRLHLTPSLVQYNLQQCCRGVFYYGTMFNYTHGFHGVYPHRLSTNRAKETNYIS